MTALAILGGHLIDPAAGVDLLKDILLKDGRVAEIAGPGKLKQANGAESLDATGLTLVTEVNPMGGRIFRTEVSDPQGAFVLHFASP